MIEAAASWSITAARSRRRPSSFSAIAALARPGPIAAASSAPVGGTGKLRLLPSGKVTATGRRIGASTILLGSSLIALCSLDQHGRPGRMVTKKPRPIAGGVVRVQALPLDQRTQLPDTPPRGVVVVVMVMRPLDPMIQISPHTDAASSRLAQGCGSLASVGHAETRLPSPGRVGIAAALSRI